MNRRHFSRSALLSACAAALGTRSAWAQVNPVEGRDYKRLPSPQPVPPGKIEVLEFFSYACPHCAAFEPVLEAWARKLPPDVALRRVPVPFLYNAANFQRTYYALETLGLVDAVQAKVFQALHVERAKMQQPEEIAAQVAKHGGDAARFLDAFRSFTVATSANRAAQMSSTYAIDGVPTLVVNGTWATSPAMAGGEAEALATVDALVQRSRKSRP